jgi:dephospho-CoA kinase
MADTYVIGLTGNIATGKSMVAAMLGALGSCVIDADRVAHEVMRAGREAHERIVERFGPEVVGPNGEIDRGRLGAIVFADQEDLRDLERIVHPAVVQETLQRIATCREPACVVEAIKLLEAEMHHHCDVVWVVTSPYSQQLKRLMTARGMTAEQANLRIEAQPPAELKVARADVVIDNSGTLEQTWQQVRRRWNEVEALPPAPRDMTWKAVRQQEGVGA